MAGDSRGPPQRRHFGTDLSPRRNGKPQYWSNGNGLTMTWSCGTVEGHVNRIKTIKRQMYGRAKLDLLRRRILTRT
jgi:hypothetical protein